MGLVPFSLVWSPPMQAAISVCTALCAGASLWYIRRSVTKSQETFRATHQAALLSYEESSRPILMLVKVSERGSQRFALYRNTGVGVAINIRQTNIFTTYSDDNVLPPNHETSLLIPRNLEMSVIEVRYESLTGKRMCTISSFHRDGSIYNQYLPDVRALGEQGIAHARGASLATAQASESREATPELAYPEEMTETVQPVRPGGRGGGVRI